MKKTLAGIALLFAAMVAAKVDTHYAPGSRTQMLAHNAYPDHGKYGDRLDRAIATGRPFVVEEDLAWIDGESLLIHGAKNAAQDDPTLESYFFPKVKPVIEKALQEGNKGNWPVVTLYLDIKNDPAEHLEAISKTLDKYNAWLTTAVKPANDSKIGPLELKPMMVIVEDKQNDIKQQFFYDRVAAGARIRVFGSPAKVDVNADKKLSKNDATDAMAALTPEQFITAGATTYRRWIGGDWALIEKGGVTRATEWNNDKEARLKTLVDYAHKKGLFFSVYCLDGYTAAENQGWDKDYNFGSHEAVVPRWKAAIKAKVDFISTDHYEDLAKLIEAGK